MGSLILGGSGLIGHRLLKKLSQHEVGVVATCRNPADRMSTSDVHWKALDLATFTDWDRLLDGVDTLYHLAWSTIPAIAALDPPRDILENVVGTVRMLEAARRVPGLRIVFASSGGTVYGPAEDLPVSETHPTRPVSAYGISKLTVENYIEKYRTLYGVDGVALRIANCYGIDQRESKGLGAVTLFARAGLRREPLKLYGDGKVVRDYIHVDDVVSALVAAGQHRNISGPINIGSGTGHSLLELITKLEAALGTPFSLQKVASRAFDVSASVLDINRAAARIGWKPAIDLDLGIEMLLQELRAELDLECGSPSTSTATTRSISTARKAIREPSPGN